MVVVSKDVRPMALGLDSVLGAMLKSGHRMESMSGAGVCDGRKSGILWMSSNIPWSNSSSWRASHRGGATPPPTRPSATAAAVPLESPDALDVSEVGGETGAAPAELLEAIPESIEAA